jgi:hypothetical protein
LNNYLVTLKNGATLAVTIDPVADVDTVSKAMTSKPAGAIHFGHESGRPAVVELKEIVALYPLTLQYPPVAEDVIQPAEIALMEDE